jgi:hypothetical protein
MNVHGVGHARQMEIQLSHEYLSLVLVRLNYYFKVEKV